MDTDNFIINIKKQIEDFNNSNHDDFETIKNMSLNDILNHSGKVYFIQAGDNGAIKIGYTDNVNKRLKQIQTGNPYKLNLLKVINGNYETERTIHKLFSKDRLEGEWFTPTKELLKFIDIGIKDNETTSCDNNSNHIFDFKNKCLKINFDTYIESTKLYEEYTKFCISNGINDFYNNTNFGEWMKMIFSKQEVIKKQKKINGYPVWIYKNLELTINNRKKDLND